MRKLLVVLLLVLGATAWAEERSAKNPLMKAETVVWAGIDYSQTIFERMEGSDSYEMDFTSPDLIFPGMLEKWNALFLDERIMKVAAELRKRVDIDISGVTERNKTASAKAIVVWSDKTPKPTDSSQSKVGNAPMPSEIITNTHLASPNSHFVNPHLTTLQVKTKAHLQPKDIAEAVRSYNMKAKSGLALVFVVDRLTTGFAHEQSGGGVHIVFFDIASREVVDSRWCVEAAGGKGFRNFWFGVIKRAEANLVKFR